MAPIFSRLRTIRTQISEALPWMRAEISLHGRKQLDLLFFLIPAH